MTTEESIVVVVPSTREVRALVADVVSAATRANKADPGDRGDVIRYESLCVQLELLAEQALIHGAEHRVVAALPDEPGYAFEDPLVAGDRFRLSARLPADLAETVTSWARDATVVELRRAMVPGATTVAAASDGPPEVASIWRSDGDVRPSEAVRQRLAAQLDAVIAAARSDRVARDHSFNPSGINNRVLTETLRSYVIGTPETRVDAPVTYRDGSQASNTFPLRCLCLATHAPKEQQDVSLDLALLSIRHTEMDPVVDGAWLRNTEVSRPRAAALTDDFVYQTSIEQLRYLTDDGNRSMLLRIYQTGLDTAIVGFYRAVVTHLLQHPTSLVVVPMFFASGAPGEARFAAGDTWTVEA